MATITIKEVARHAGVSKSTVSRALNDQPHISKTTRMQVLNAIEELGFQPSIFARNIKLRKTNTIGVIMSRAIIDLARNPFFRELMDVVESVLSKEGYHFLFTTIDAHLSRDYTLPKMLIEKRVDGVLMIGHMDDGFLSKLKEENVPFVITEDYSENVEIETVITDDYKGAMKAMRYLIDLGHRRIGFLGGPLQYPSIHNRYQAYRYSLEENGIEYKLYIDTSLDYNGGYSAGKKVLDSKERPTALLCANDWLAAGTIAFLKEAEVKLPSEMSIVGFDNIPLAKETSPPLTTVWASVEEIGRIAVERLFIQLNADNPDRLPRKTVVPMELIVRESCSSPL